jgi:hypothetical protein
MAAQHIKNVKTRLANGLTAWLTFEFSCERGYLFSEYYLAHAIGQILRGYGPNVRAEVPHPTLAVDGETGRPPSLDFVLYSEQNTPLLAVETKWAGFSETSVGASIWDAFRLEAFCRTTRAPGLLIVAGTRQKLTKLFASSKFRRAVGGKSDPKGRTLLPLRPSDPNCLKRSDLPRTVLSLLDEKTKSLDPGLIADVLTCDVCQLAQHKGAPQAISYAVYVWVIHSKGFPMPSIQRESISSSAAIVSPKSDDKHQRPSRKI